MARAAKVSAFISINIPAHHRAWSRIRAGAASHQRLALPPIGGVGHRRPASPASAIRHTMHRHAKPGRLFIIVNIAAMPAILRTDEPAGFAPSYCITQVGEPVQAQLVFQADGTFSALATARLALRVSG